MRGKCYNNELDDRYTETGFVTNEFDMMESNRIFRMLENNPSWHRYTERTAFTENEFRSWNRGNIPWKLSCETGSGQETRDIAMELAGI